LRGNTPVHEALEGALAHLKSTPAALVFASGYAANLGVLAALCEPDDVIYCDRLDHASLVDGARLGRAHLHFYDHTDLDRLESRLRRAECTPGARWIATDGVFSMDGTLAPLPELATLAHRYGAVLVVDDAHATGVLGPGGAGTLAHFGIDPENIVQIGTLSKALGSQGGFVAGDAELIEWLVQRARAFIYSTGIAPALAAAAHEALRIVEEEPQRRARLHAHVRSLRVGLCERGWTVLGEEPAPMIAVVTGSADSALQLSERLHGHGVIAPAIRPPTVPKGTSRVRLAPRADFTEAEVERVLDAFGSRAN
jgi:8-amino-7-oxononanoate synthase